LAEEQLAELATLREEVQKLRHRTNDLQTMKAEIRRLRLELADARSVITSNAPPDVPAADIYPRESWAFAGYDTPEAALQSLTWAISEGDEDAYLAGLSPALRGEMQAQLADGSFSDIGPMEMSDATGYRIVGRESVSDNQKVFRIRMDGDADDVPLTLEKTSDGWRVSSQSGGQNP
jgi:hypothetical protein